MGCSNYELTKQSINLIKKEVEKNNIDKISTLRLISAVLDSRDIVTDTVAYYIVQKEERENINIETYIKTSWEEAIFACIYNINKDISEIKHIAKEKILNMLINNFGSICKERS